MRVLINNLTLQIRCGLRVSPKAFYAERWSPMWQFWHSGTLGKCSLSCLRGVIKWVHPTFSVPLHAAVFHSCFYFISQPWALIRGLTQGFFILNFLSPKLQRNFLYKLSGLWYFVIASQKGSIYSRSGEENIEVSLNFFFFWQALLLDIMAYD